MPIQFDCHVHTELSACSEDISLKWLCRQAHETDLCFAVTDHSMHFYYGPIEPWRMYSDNDGALFRSLRDHGRERILRHYEAVRGCQAPRMLFGVELDVLPTGEIMFPDDLRDLVDIMLGSIHYLPSAVAETPTSQVEEEFKRQNLQLMDYGIDILAHPFRTIRAKHIHDASEELVEWTVDTAARYDVALELNSHQKHPDHDLLMARLCLEKNVPVAIGTDAHNTLEFGDFSYHRMILHDSGWSEADMRRMLYTPARCPAV